MGGNEVFKTTTKKKERKKMNPGLFEVSGEGGCSMLEAWNNDSHMYDGKKEKRKKPLRAGTKF